MDIRTMYELCTCTWEGGYGELEDYGQKSRRTPAAGCPVHAEEDLEDAEVAADLAARGVR